MIAFTVVAAVAVLAVSPLLLVKNSCCGPWPQALNNGKQIHLALMEFEREFGAFPSQDSGRVVTESTGSDIVSSGPYSNDFFRQLLAADLGNEQMFRAHIKGWKRADDVVDKGHALEKGECGFSYIPGYTRSSNPRFPVVITPLIPGTDRVDRDVFEGKALVVMLDGDVEEAKMDKKGHVMVFGKRLLDPTNPIWEGRVPVIAWPE